MRTCSIKPSKILLEKAVLKCSHLVAHGKEGYAAAAAAAAGAVVGELVPGDGCTI
jgi:hypothetical protein